MRAGELTFKIDHDARHHGFIAGVWREDKLLRVSLEGHRTNRKIVQSFLSLGYTGIFEVDVEPKSPRPDQGAMLIGNGYFLWIKGKMVQNCDEFARKIGVAELPKQLSVAALCSALGIEMRPPSGDWDAATPTAIQTSGGEK